MQLICKNTKINKRTKRLCMNLFYSSSDKKSWRLIIYNSVCMNSIGPIYKVSSTIEESASNTPFTLSLFSPVNCIFYTISSNKSASCKSSSFAY
ncbi:hypothetical protein NEIRO03_1190 [Nematocida sp. AWRm78]|nr:hypothetical protein NEIRO03_1190 [Nematocida sp. AWRm78]